MPWWPPSPVIVHAPPSPMVVHAPPPQPHVVVVQDRRGPPQQHQSPPQQQQQQPPPQQQQPPKSGFALKAKPMDGTSQGDLQKAKSSISAYLIKVEALNEVLSKYLNPMSKDKSLLQKLSGPNKGTIKLKREEKNHVLELARPLLDTVCFSQRCVVCLTCFRLISLFSISTDTARFAAVPLVNVLSFINGSCCGTGVGRAGLFQGDADVRLL